MHFDAEPERKECILTQSQREIKGMHFGAEPGRKEVDFLQSDTGEKGAGPKNGAGLKEELSKKAGAIKGKGTQPQKARAVKETGEPQEKADAAKGKEKEPKSAGAAEEKERCPKKAGPAIGKEEKSGGVKAAQPSPAESEKQEKAITAPPIRPHASGG